MCSPESFVGRSNLLNSETRLRFLRNESADEERLFQGQVRWHNLRTGLSLHCSDCHELQDFCTEVEVLPRLSFALFLEGHSDVRYGDKALRIGSRLGAPPEGLAIALAEPALFSREAKRGAHVRKLVVSLAPEWFESGGLDEHAGYAQIVGFKRKHLEVRHWQPSARLLALAEQMLCPPGYSPMLQNLYLESRALEIAGEALTTITHEATLPVGSLRPHEHRRLLRVVELLDSGAADGWSLERIAREAGVNTSTLQRQFRLHKGTTVFEYQRVRKLLEAREALERQGANVAQAAWIAGYNSATNFATAFKRQFGLTPKQVRGRI
ncbi:AraC family transcriptional regulator [Pseudomonas kuykendallii]|uniref:AraC-type DNA-binding protein n=1 Tax=Pseudomonas kuykendallii TaxID=1007099 RepID=A0A1H2RM88_9PSED|nr:AraC family transcriptional regulator [Pseudomonas kuykendallii]MCQ4272703.1 AraC family transcriptional regulator [Pseudomonas kuykendallii]SDW19759.1 AraC-type DNA-binding protein [Pseudomonas kuykendallii]